MNQTLSSLFSDAKFLTVDWHRFVWSPHVVRDRLFPAAQVHIPKAGMCEGRRVFRNFHVCRASSAHSAVKLQIVRGDISGRRSNATVLFVESRWSDLADFRRRQEDKAELSHAIEGSVRKEEEEETEKIIFTVLDHFYVHSTIPNA